MSTIPEDTVAVAQGLASAFASLPQISDDLAFYNAAFEGLYEECPLALGKEASRDERDRCGYHSSTLVYGEIAFRPFAEQFLKVFHSYGGLPPGGKFVDIGTGTGKPVFAAALLHDFDECVGIEILEGLHALCNQLLARWNNIFREHLPVSKQNTNISFLHGDATLIDWSDASCVFANSTCFDDALMQTIAQKAEELRPGAIFITTTRNLPSSAFRILEQSKMKETWGEATIFIQQKM